MLSETRFVRQPELQETESTHFKWNIMRNKAMIPCSGNSHSHSVMPWSFCKSHIYSKDDTHKNILISESWVWSLNVWWSPIFCVTQGLLSSGYFPQEFHYWGFELLKRGLFAYGMQYAQWWHFTLSIVCWHLKTAISTHCVIT